MQWTLCLMVRKGEFVACEDSNKSKVFSVFDRGKLFSSFRLQIESKKVTCVTSTVNLKMVKVTTPYSP